jgi:phospholipid/cholesterol/gamma-HCH transport system substrate-binding protein
MNRAMWLGFLFLTALIVLGFGTLIVSDLDLFRKPVFLQVHFEKVQGLRSGDDVRVDGVLFGKVKELALHPQSGVTVTLRLNGPVVLFSDGEILVESSSVLGGSFVSIKRGSRPPELTLDRLLPGKSLPGLEEVGKMVDENRENFRELVKHLREVAQALSTGKGSAGKLIQSPELHDQAAATLKKVEEAVGEFKRVGEKVNEKLSSEFIDGALSNVHHATENLRLTTDRIERGEGTLGALLNDRKMKDRLDRTLDNVEKTSENLKSVTDKVNRGEGTLGTLVNDKETAEKIRRTVDNIEKSSESIRGITGRLESGEGSVGKLLQDDELYEKAKQTLDDIDKVFAKAARAVVEVVGDSKLYDDSEAQISRLGIRISPSEDKYFQVGAAFLSLNKEGEILFKNLVEDNENGTEVKGEILLGYRIPWFLDRRLSVKVGLLEGKPGGGAELRWDDWLLVTHPVEFVFEMRDAYNDLDDEDIDENLDGPLLRFYAKMPVWTRRNNWFEVLLSTLRVYGGVSRIGEDPEGMVGIGLEWPDDDIRTLVSFIGLAR